MIFKSSGNNATYLAISMAISCSYMIISADAFGSVPASALVDQATSAIINFIPGRKVCTSGEAAKWLRAAFHDAGTFVASTKSGGADGSLAFEQGRDPQTGMGLIITNRVVRTELSTADTIQLAGTIAVPRCGGPIIPFQTGRVDAPQGTMNDLSLLPSPYISVELLKRRFAEMGLNEIDMLVLTTGSHTLGGATRNVTVPDLPVFKENPRQVFAPFDDTPDVFDNHIWQAVLGGKCILPIDCALANDETLLPYIRRWARHQESFFKQYVLSFQKMTVMAGRNSKLSPFMDLNVSTAIL